MINLPSLISHTVKTLNKIWPESMPWDMVQLDYNSGGKLQKFLRQFAKMRKTWGVKNVICSGRRDYKLTQSNHAHKHMLFHEYAEPNKAKQS